MTTIKTADEIKILKDGGFMLADILNEVQKSVEEGVTTKYLDELAESLILKNGATPSFKNYNPAGSPRPYPASMCTCINEEVVHSIPSERKLKNGDLFSFDLGLWLKELCVDAARTKIVGGKGSKTAEKLIWVTENSLYEGIGVIREGAKLGDIGHAIQSYVEKNSDFGIVRDLTGHGVGYKVHEDPYVLNYGRKGTGETLISGMVLALEPMITEGSYHIKYSRDGWGIETKDGKLSAHFEHTIVVTKDGFEILTTTS
ncbi:MAG: type I methionyl aminopeptidase [Patescibacteria group bacterium]